MKAWRTHEGTVRLEEVPDPEPGPDELLVGVEVCGVCRTDLHVVDGDLPVHRAGVVPGHQVVGRVLATGPGVVGTAPGDRVGVAWLHRTCGVCRWCRSGRENLCPEATFTGWDVDGGCAERVLVPEAFAHPLPHGDDALGLAPLLCAGIIGYRALRRTNLPPGGLLGIYGFGSSGHITAQLALAAGSRVVTVTRGEEEPTARGLARGRGGPRRGRHARRALDAAIVFAPVGDLLVRALDATAPGGTVVSAGIHMSPVTGLDYDRSLFRERDLRSVTANTRADATEFLALAHNLGLAPSVTQYRLADVDRALEDLRSGRSSGSLVVRVS